MPTWIVDPENVSLVPGAGCQKSVVSLRAFEASCQCLTSRQASVPIGDRLDELKIWGGDNIIWAQIIRVRVTTRIPDISILVGNLFAGPSPPGIEGTFYRISTKVSTVPSIQSVFLYLTHTPGSKILPRRYRPQSRSRSETLPSHKRKYCICQ
jgi:hypothetical protein